MANPNMHEDNKGKITHSETETVIVKIEPYSVDGNNDVMFVGYTTQEVYDMIVAGKNVIIKGDYAKNGTGTFYHLYTRFSNQTSYFGIPYSTDTAPDKRRLYFNTASNLVHISTNT